MKITMLGLVMFFSFIPPALASGSCGGNNDCIYINQWDNYNSQPIKRLEPKWEVPTVAVRSVVVNKFVLSNGYVDYDNPLLQSDLLVRFKNGFYINLWNSKPLGGKPTYNSVGEKGSDQGESVTVTGNELDYTVGWYGPLVFGTVMDVGASYCDLPSFGKVGAVEDVLYNYVKLSKTAGAGFGLNIMVEKFTVMHKSPYRGGALYAVGASRSDLYLKDKLTLDMSLDGVYDTGNFGNQHGELIRGKVEFDWNFFKSLTIILPKVDSYMPINKAYDNRKMETAITGGFVYRFN